MRILVVEPDSSQARCIDLMLKWQGFCVYVTSSGEEAVELAKLYDYDLMTLELKLPDMSGFDVIRHLAAAKCRTPILVVSSVKHIQDKVLSLGLGAADHIAKPFHRNELVARILAIVRRCHGHACSQIEIGPLHLDLQLRALQVNGGRALHLTPKEYAIVEILMLKAGKTLSRDVLLNNMYSGVEEPGEKVLDVFISYLRKKLTGAGAPGAIETVRGRGFRINPTIPTLQECLDIA